MRSINWTVWTVQQQSGEVCRMEATAKREPYTPTRCHLDPIAARAQRQELERLLSLDGKIGKDGQP
jgi:hypothetical protein